jgi:Domain of unknown function (DUF6438)
LRFRFTYLILFVIVALQAVTLMSCANKRKVQDVAAAEPPKVEEAIAVVDSVKKVEDVLTMYYERTPCFGMCPIFKLEVFESGKARFEGKNYTELIGIYSSQFTQQEMDKIMALADRIGFFQFQEKYDNPAIQDFPTITVALYKEEKLKYVVNKYRGPKELNDMYTLLDKIIEEKEWTLIKKETNNK